MTTGSNSCYNPNNDPQALPEYAVCDQEHVVSSSLQPSSSTNTFLHNISLLKEKVHQVQSLASIFISPDHGGQSSESTVAMAVAMPTMGTLIQEIIVTASSMMFACQQMTLCAHSDNNTANHELKHQQQVKPPDDMHNSRVARLEEERGQGFYAMDGLEWYGDHYNTCNTNDAEARKDLAHRDENNGDSQELSTRNYDIVELDAADLLAKYTHHCQVCGKGFKRDANLRMHMRAHGESYKSSAALCNPLKNNGPGEDGTGTQKLPRKYSCPQEGCRWNRKHAKFQPLKSMICVKNHYRRSHCPKMYVCNRCNRKQFSVLSDLRTHEKHCGDNKWQCSCGTTFSRKDKLMGHVALFVGHTPVITSSSKMAKAYQNL